MKIRILIIITLFIGYQLEAQIASDFINDFEDDTTQGWINGGTSPNPPTNIPSGGPDGIDDNYLEEISSGGSGEGSRLIVFNVNPEWQGDYTGAGVNQISFYAKNGHTTDLYLRIGFSGGVGSKMVTTNAVFLPSSQTDWIFITIPINAADFTMTNGPNTPGEVLLNVNGIRIFSNPNISYVGEAIEGTMHLDNIITENILSIEDSNLEDFTIYPNPASEKITLVIPYFEDVNIDIYSLLGEKIQNQEISSKQTQIDISNLSSGVYLLKFSNGKEIFTQKLIKK